MRLPPLAPDGLPEGMPDEYGIPTLGVTAVAYAPYAFLNLLSPLIAILIA